MPTRSERRRPHVRLSVAEVDAAEGSQPVVELPLIGVAVLAGAASGVVGWLLVTGLVMTAWFTAMAIPLPAALGFASQLWLAAHGAGAMVAGVLVTVIPLGLSLLLVLLTRTVTALALRATASTSLDGAGAARAVGLAAAGYALTAGIVALAAGSASRIGWAVLGGAVVGGLGAAWALAGRLRALIKVPAALAGLGRAVLGGLGVMTAIAASVLLLGLLLGSHRIGMIEDALAPDAVGAWLLSVLQLLYLPNLLAWSASWALGAGISVGVGSLVSPVLTTAGMLPAIPALGAVPEPGVGGPWSYAWLASGLIVGAAAGWVAAAGPSTRGSLVRWLARGAGAGLVTAVALLMIAALSRGDLGAGRLVALGPVMVNLTWLAPVPMVAGGAVAALVHWLARGRRLPPQVAPEDSTEQTDLAAESEAETVVLGQRDG